jgi:hypothetical protein
LKEFGDLALVDNVAPDGAASIGKKRRFDTKSVTLAAELARKYGDVNTTVLARRYEGTQAALRKLQTENEQLQMSLENVLKEVDKKAPQISRLYADQETVSTAYTKLSSWLADAIQMTDRLREEGHVYESERDQAVQQREALQREATALRKQVGRMCRAPAGGSKRSRRGSILALQGTSAPLSPEQQVRVDGGGGDGGGGLLADHQELQRKVAELQTELNLVHRTMRGLPLQAKLNEAAAELEELRGQRAAQGELLADVLKQRDNFKALLKAQIEEWDAGGGTGGGEHSVGGGAARSELAAEQQCMKMLELVQKEYTKSQQEAQERIDELRERLKEVGSRAAAAEMRATKLQAAVEEAGRAASERQGLEDELARRGQALQAQCDELEAGTRGRDRQARVAAAELEAQRAELSQARSAGWIVERKLAAATRLQVELGEENERLSKASRGHQLQLAEAIDARTRERAEAAVVRRASDERQQDLVKEVAELESELQREQEEHSVARTSAAALTLSRDAAEQLAELRRSQLAELRSAQAEIRAICAQLRRDGAKAARAPGARIAAAAAAGSLSTPRGAAPSFELSVANALELALKDEKAAAESAREEASSLSQQLIDQQAQMSAERQQLEALGAELRAKATALDGKAAELSESRAAAKRAEAERAVLAEAVEKAEAAGTQQEAERLRLQVELEGVGAAGLQQTTLLEERAHELEASTVANVKLKHRVAKIEAQLRTLQASADSIEKARSTAARAQDTLAATEARRYVELQAMQVQRDEAEAGRRDLRQQNDLLLAQLERAMAGLARADGFGQRVVDAANADAGAAGEAEVEEPAALVVQGLREVVSSLSRAREVADSKFFTLQQKSSQQQAKMKAELGVWQQRAAAADARAAADVGGGGGGSGAVSVEAHRELRQQAEAMQQVQTRVEQLQAEAREHVARLQAALNGRRAAEGKAAEAKAAEAEAEAKAARLVGELSGKERWVEIHKKKHARAAADFGGLRQACQLAAAQLAKKAKMIETEEALLRPLLDDRNLQKKTGMHWKTQSDKKEAALQAKQAELAAAHAATETKAAEIDAAQKELAEGRLQLQSSDAKHAAELKATKAVKEAAEERAKREVDEAKRVAAAAAAATHMVSQQAAAEGGAEAAAARLAAEAAEAKQAEAEQKLQAQQQEGAKLQADLDRKKELLREMMEKLTNLDGEKKELQKEVEKLSGTPAKAASSEAKPTPAAAVAAAGKGATRPSAAGKGAAKPAAAGKGATATTTASKPGSGKAKTKGGRGKGGRAPVVGTGAGAGSVVVGQITPPEGMLSAEAAPFVFGAGTRPASYKFGQQLQEEDGS